MSISLGISCSESSWRACVLNDSCIQEYRADTEWHELSLYIEQGRSKYIDLRITLASPLDTPLRQLSEMVDAQSRQTRDNTVGKDKAGEWLQLLSGCSDRWLRLIMYQEYSMCRACLLPLADAT